MLISRHNNIGFAVLTFLLIMAFRNGIVGWIYDKNAWLIGCENKTWLCALLGVCSAAIVVHIIHTVRHGLHFQTKVCYWSYIVLAAIVYAWLRLDGHFEFYTIVGNVAWADILISLFLVDRILVSKVSSKTKEKSRQNDNGLSSIQQDAEDAEKIKKDIQIILDKPIKDKKDDLMKYSQISAQIYNNLIQTDVSEKIIECWHHW